MKLTAKSTLVRPEFTPAANNIWNSTTLLAAATRAAKQLAQSPLVPEEYRGNIGSEEHGVFLRAVLADGTTIDGPVITMARAASEGWLDRPDSKWRTMPDIMLRYRAAAYFGRVCCPTVLMGLHTDDELRERGEAPSGPTEVFTLPGSTAEGGNAK